MKVVKISGKEYLEYSYREKSKDYKIRKRVQKDNNIEELKMELLIEIFEKRWEEDLSKLIKNYEKQFYSLPKPIQIKSLKQFGIRFTHNTNKIEGSSLSLVDVNSIIVDKITPANKPLDDTIEAKKHMGVYTKMCNEPYDLTWERVLKWHKELFRETMPSIAGDFRNYEVFISGSKYNPPASRFEVDLLLDELLSFWQKNKESIHPILMACLMHLRFVSIHPFGDGNGRISRVLMNYALYHSKCPMFDIPAKIRRTYYNALERANLKDDESIFLQWFMRNYFKANKKFR